MENNKPEQEETLFDPQQEMLFDIPPDWNKTWVGMPGYTHGDLESERDIIVHFRNGDDIQKFAKHMNQRITDQTKSIWYPKLEIEPYFHKKYVSEFIYNPKYPIYIISKGRWDSRQTSKALEKLDVAYRIVVEPQEYEEYAKVIEPRKILTLPFSNLGQGSIPARNWVWEHAIKSGAKRHWILDDNIKGFHRYQNNFKQPVADGTIFRCAEDFVDRYKNVAISGFNYFMFVVRKCGRIPPFYLNTRIYSCILIQNDIPYRWRGRYNEDTDLSIRALKDGHCTILFNAFLADKSQTLTMKGGNTDQLYKDDGRMKMAESLRDQHPDIVTITTKWGRPQHQVNYRVFKNNKLVLDPNAVISEIPNEYGMQIRVFEREADNPEQQPEEETNDERINRNGQILDGTQNQQSTSIIESIKSAPSDLPEESQSTYAEAGATFTEEPSDSNA